MYDGETPTADGVPADCRRDACLPTAVFILGVGRSGTTLLRTMLAGAPEFFCPPELNILQYRTIRQQSLRHAWGLLFALRAGSGRPREPFRSFWDLYRRNASTAEVFATLQDWISPRILVDKSPEYGFCRHAYSRMEALFESPRYLWLTRHPAAVVDSFQRRGLWMRPHLQGMTPEELWRGGNLRIRNFLRTVDPSRWYRLRYEDLVTDSARAMNDVAEYLRVPFRPAMTDPYDGAAERYLGGLSHQWLNGDPWFTDRRAIQPELSTDWRRRETGLELDPRSIHLAETLGYPPPRGSEMSDCDI